MPKGVVMAALQIRRDDTALDLRRRAARERDRRAAMRLLALANALEGMTRAEAARLAGIQRQALHDAVHRVLDDDEAVLEATCRAWRMLLMEKGRLATLTAYRYLLASAIP